MDIWEDEIPLSLWDRPYYRGKRLRSQPDVLELYASKSQLDRSHSATWARFVFTLHN